ncbi:MAG TPA: MdtA/MuxA family multidrug efflux RND transporter periplasmic adaptor subunit [Accumulibacter sp.]|jgi:multidrug efflux system membrane fusion protein|nr:MdtA/MuxA family multidrug efflux RND transporter periplasmic adaptor subunit [Accumulibacter sp.]HQC80108.1 MdtA/MuxA family multidrug efflux RND transporter periplasmic adaptor subunit [Accumulibacter sp.]
MTNDSLDPDAVPVQPQGKGRHRSLALGAVVLLGGGLLVAAYHFSGRDEPKTAESAGQKSGRPNADNRGQPVSVATVAVKDVRLWIPAIGTAIPRNLVTVRSRVDGELLRLHFNEGDTVKQGQLLAEIDPRPYQAQVTQVNGQLNRDLALLQNARVDLARYRELWAKDSIAKQQVDTQAALVRQYEGTVENDRGQLDNAKLQLNYTRVSAPVAGRIGLRQIDPGNQIRASDANGLASIAQIEPMTVVFSVPEGQLPEIHRRLRERSVLAAEAWDRAQKNQLANGRLLTTDNQIDPTTGTIKLKAEFANTDHALFPNQFVNVRLLLGVQKEATVIPSAAIQRGARGTFVYAVDGENSVKAVPVSAGAVDGELTAVDGALTPGDKVVSDGADKLRDGAKVEVISPEKSRATADDAKDGRRGRRSEGGGRGRDKEGKGEKSEKDAKGSEAAADGKAGQGAS